MINGDYIFTIAPDNYPGHKYRGRYIQEHQLVWWQNTGHAPTHGEVVHHKNKDKHDNRFENLELLTNVEHGKLHAIRCEPVKIICFNCGKEHFVRGNNYDYKKRIGQTNWFCSRRCVWNFYRGSHNCKGIRKVAIKKVCKGCGVEFEDWSLRNHKEYCNRTCYHRNYRKNKKTSTPKK